MSIALPDAGDGSRRRRRQRRSARRLVLRLVAAAVLVVIVGGIGWLVVNGADDGEPGVTEASSSSTAVDPLADEPPGLVLLRNGVGELYGASVFAPATRSIVHVPPGALVEAPSLGLVTLRDAGDVDDELVRQSLENLLGVRFARVDVLDPAALGAAIADVSPLTVDVGNAVQEVTASGRVTIVVPDGEQQVTAEEVVPLLEAVGSGTTLERLTRHQAFWTAYLRAGGRRVASARALVGEPVRQRVLPVEAVAGVSGADEQYRVDEPALAELIARLFPSAAAAGRDRVRVQILNGVGVAGVAQRVQPLLVDAGGRMTLSGNADRFDYTVTQVVYYDDDDLPAARAIQRALGVGEVVKSLAGLEVVDVTVVVGADFMSPDSPEPEPGPEG